MNVDRINSVYFRANSMDKKTVESSVDTKAQVNELLPVVPDYNVKLPQTYTSLGVRELPNGLKVHQYKLSNGYKVSVVPMEDSPTIVKNYVNVGSMNETNDIKGISHFLEHMAFNGTNGENGHLKLETGDSFQKIEELGGWCNASTNYAVTDYVNSTPQLNKGDLETQLKVIAAMTEDLKLSEEMIEKEKHPVSSEINMILDDPQTIAMDQTIRTLYNIKNPTDEMVGGSVKGVKSFTRKDLLDYYNKYYTPDNMNLVVTGNVDPKEVMELVSKNFTSRKISVGRKFEEPMQPLKTTVRKDFLSDKAQSTNIVLGFNGPKNNDTREILKMKLAKQYLLSSAIPLTSKLKESNTYPFIMQEKVSSNPNNSSMLLLALTTSDENSEKVLKKIFQIIPEVKKPTIQKLEELKLANRTSFEQSMEYSSIVNKNIGYAELVGEIDGLVKYEELLDSITPEDIEEAISKYFDLSKVAITVVHPETKNEIKKVGLQTREPLNLKNVETQVLGNNYNVGLYTTKNNNVHYNLILNTVKPYHKKAGVIEVLDALYSMGTAKKKGTELSAYEETNNLKTNVSVSNTGMMFSSRVNSNNVDKLMEISKEILYEPRFTEKALNKAKAQVKDYMTRSQDSAFKEYVNYEYDSSRNPNEFSYNEILENIDSITLDDVKDAHEYLLNNSMGYIIANVPKKHPDIKDVLVNESKNLNTVKPHEVIMDKLYKENTSPVVLKKAYTNSQADIMQVNQFKFDDTLKNRLVATVSNSILSNSSIGLFNVLREKEHLAYSVYSDIDFYDDKGEVFCNILTTTDNKEIGEVSYDNVQKSINGFNKQIEALKSGQFTDKDLESAKRSLKASLLSSESVSQKLRQISFAMDSKYGISMHNDMFKEVDNITRDDVIAFANKAFSNHPIYSIAATQDTLDYNKEYLESLKQNV